jgi:septum formation protein
VVAPRVQELEQGIPEQVAIENARRKAAAVDGDLVLGVDTIVAVGERIYGKPGDADAARKTLRALSGRRHAVVGGICLIAADGRERSAAARTEVEFRELGDELVAWYLATGEWRDRAGAYAIQGRGAALVKRIEGDYLNVVGLPLATLLELEPTLLWSWAGRPLE